MSVDVNSLLVGLQPERKLGLLGLDRTMGWGTLALSLQRLLLAFRIFTLTWRYLKLGLTLDRVWLSQPNTHLGVFSQMVAPLIRDDLQCSLFPSLLLVTLLACK